MQSVMNISYLLSVYLIDAWYIFEACDHDLSICILRLLSGSAKPQSI